MGSHVFLRTSAQVGIRKAATTEPNQIVSSILRIGSTRDQGKYHSRNSNTGV